MTLNASEMIISISKNVPDLISLATAIAYVTGMYIIVTSIAGMRNSPAINQPGQGQVSMWSHVKHIFVGAALIYFPSAVHTATETLFGDYSVTSAYAYVVESGNPFSEVISAVFLIVKLVGVIAIIKGIYELGYDRGSTSKDGSHISSFGKGITHVIAGAMCVNLHETLTMIFNTLGITGIIN